VHELGNLVQEKAKNDLKTNIRPMFGLSE